MRTTIAATDLRLPECATPRPGERVTWHQDRSKLEGVLLGHRADGRPVVQNQFGISSFPESFDAIRRTDPTYRTAPNWHRLPEAGRR